MRTQPQAAMNDGLPRGQHVREAALLPSLIALIDHHRRACPAYARVLDAIGHSPERRYSQLRELPWLPVRLFKEHPLISTDSERVTVLTSSGTTGTGVSRIALDRDAAERQRRMLTATLERVTGPRRLPLLIVDSPSAVRQERSSIRGATVLGVMNVGREHVFALNDEHHINASVVDNFLQRHGRETFLIFGFTSLVWTQFYELARSRAFDLTNALLLHTGGWKKLADQSVSAQEFRTRFRDATGLRRCHNFYGMVEQGGTIHVESACGDGLYCPDFADVIIRDPQTWEEAAVGMPGVIEVLSTAPRAHPGHVLLTEDIGVVQGIDDGEWPGKRFAVLGRLARAEPRGCADTLPEPSHGAQP
jgi:Acyl-protein synthetase, LuxE